MENAVRALYITAGVLIAVMVLSLAVLLYKSLQGYVEDANQQIKYNDINSFNTKYMNYANKTVTIQDVVTVASIEYENNRSHDIDINQWNANPNALYVPISCLSSSTILVIVVRHTSAATIIKNTGNTAAIAVILSALDL